MVLELLFDGHFRLSESHGGKLNGARPSTHIAVAHGGLTRLTGLPRFNKIDLVRTENHDAVDEHCIRSKGSLS